jgi:adenylate kinase
MIVLFGSAGSGKSTQGQILAKEHNWKWLSTGQMFRETNNPEAMAYINRGNLVPDAITNEIVFEALDAKSICGEKGGVILDGYPRSLDQAKTLVQYGVKRCKNNNINLAVMIDVDKDEVIKRMTLRGRTDDTPEEIEKRLAIYHEAINPILDYFSEQNIPVEHVDGVGDVSDIHKRIEAALIKHGVTESRR